MKKKISRFIGFFLIVICCIIAVPLDDAHAASSYYDVDAAMTYAAAHWNDGKGMCADFVSRCTRAGGLGSYSTFAGTTFKNLEKETGLTRNKLNLNSSGYATQSLNKNTLSRGDVVVQYCTTCNRYPHVVICSGFNSKGNALYYGHSNAWNNKTMLLNENALHKKSTCNVIAYSLHLSSLPSEPVQNTYAIKETGVDFKTVGIASVETLTAWSNDQPYGMFMYYGESTSSMTNQSAYTLHPNITYGKSKDFDFWLNNVQAGKTYYYYLTVEDTKGHEAVRTATRSITIPSADDYETTLTIAPPEINGTTCNYQNALFKTTATGEGVFGIIIRYGTDPNNLNQTHDYTTTYKEKHNGDDTVTWYLWMSHIEPNTTYYYQIDSLDINENTVDTTGIQAYTTADHPWDEGVITQEATTSHPGTIQYTCTSCGETKTELYYVAQRIVLNRSKLELLTSNGNNGKDSTFQLLAEVGPSSAIDTSVTWTSSNPSVASVDANGLVTAHTYGKATITAATASGLTRTCEVKVNFYDGVEGIKNGSNTITESIASAISWMADEGYTKGYDGVYFGSFNTTSRRDFVIFLWRFAGKPRAINSGKTFSDANYDANTDSYKAIAWATSNGIINGYADGTFKPNAAVSRAQVATMIWKYAGRPNAAASSKFPDVEVNSNGLTTNMVKAINWCNTNGIVKGYGSGKFEPSGNCLRFQMAIILYRYNDKFFS